MKRMASKTTRRRRPEADLPKKRSRHLDGVTEVDPQDYEFLRKFVTEHGKIMPARLTGANAKQQRQIKRGVRRAREIGILA
jgi:small subunit ribosomal protein S18